MQNRLFRTKKFTPNATEACVHIQNLADALQKHFEYDQIKIKIFGWGYAAFEKRKGKNHKLPSLRHSLKFKDTFSCEIFTQKDFPSFQPIFNFRQEC
jgi:hypothetical protein